MFLVQGSFSLYVPLNSRSCTNGYIADGSDCHTPHQSLAVNFHTLHKFTAFQALSILPDHKRRWNTPAWQSQIKKLQTPNAGGLHSSLMCKSARCQPWGMMADDGGGGRETQRERCTIHIAGLELPWCITEWKNEGAVLVVETTALWWAPLWKKKCLLWRETNSTWVG